MKINYKSVLPKMAFFSALISIVCMYYVVVNKDAFLRYAIFLFGFYGMILVCRRARARNKTEIFTIYAVLILGIFLLQLFKFSHAKASTSRLLMNYLPALLMVIFSCNEESSITFIKLYRLMSILLACSIFISVIIPSFFSSSLSFLFKPVVLAAINKEIGNGVYSGFVGEKAYAAHLLAVGCGIEIAMLFDSETKLLNKKRLMMIVFYLAAMMLTGKRTLFVVLLGILFLAFLLSEYKQKAIKLVPYIMGSIIALILIVNIVPQAQIVLLRLLETEDLTTGNGRIYFWETAFQMFENNKAMGYGLGGYMDYQERFASTNGFNAHNSYIQLIGESGIIGCSVFFSMFALSLIVAIHRVYKYKTQIARMCLYIILISLLYATTGNVMHSFSQFFVYYFALNILQIGLDQEDLDYYLSKRR